MRDEKPNVIMSNPSQKDLESMGITYNQRDLKNQIERELDIWSTELMKKWTSVYDDVNKVPIVTTIASCTHNFALSMMHSIATASQSPEVIRHLAQILIRTGTQFNREADEVERRQKKERR